MTKKEEIKEMNEILKRHGLNRKERRMWMKTIRKEARIKA